MVCQAHRAVFSGLSKANPPWKEDREGKRDEEGGGREGRKEEGKEEKRTEGRFIRLRRLGDFQG